MEKYEGKNSLYINQEKETLNSPIDTQNKELENILNQKYSESTPEQFDTFSVEIPLSPDTTRWANLKNLGGKNEFHIPVINSGKNEIILAVSKRLFIPIGSIDIKTTKESFDRPFRHEVVIRKTTKDIDEKKAVGSEYYKGSIVIDPYQMIYKTMNQFSCINSSFYFSTNLVSIVDTEKVLRRMVAGSLEVKPEDLLIKYLYNTHGLLAYDVFHKASVQNKKEETIDQKIYRGSIGVYEDNEFLYAYKINNQNLIKEGCFVGNKLTKSLEYNLRIEIAKSLKGNSNEAPTDSIQLQKFGDNLFDIYY